MSPFNFFTLLLVTGGLIVTVQAKGEDEDKLSSLMNVLQAKFNADRSNICSSYRELEDAREQNLDFIDVGQGMGYADPAQPGKVLFKSWVVRKTIREVASENREQFNLVMTDFHEGSDYVIRRYQSLSKQIPAEEKKLKEKSFQLEKELEAEPSNLCSPRK